MKRIIIAFGIGAIVFGGIFGLAASLGVSSATLGSGSSAVAACQAGAVSVSYAPTYSASGYEATTVTVGGLAASCNNKSFKVSLTDGFGVSLGEKTGNTGAGASVDLAFSGVEVAGIEGVQVAIYG